jgi:hypothetical protein
MDRSEILTRDLVAIVLKLKKYSQCETEERTLRNYKKVYAAEILECAAMVRQQSEELSEPLDENGVADLVQSLVRVQSKTAGRPSTLNAEEETKIYHYVQERAARGIPISKAELIEEVSQFAAKIGAKRRMTLVGSSSGKSVRTTYYVERLSESWF